MRRVIHPAVIIDVGAARPRKSSPCSWQSGCKIKCNNRSRGGHLALVSYLCKIYVESLSGLYSQILLHGTVNSKYAALLVLINNPEHSCPFENLSMIV